MRIARSMIFTQSLNGMNGAMSDIIRLNEQAASQKRINRPSDDPGGMARVLDLQDHLNMLSQYDENIATATGWLDTANEQYNTISSTIARVQELASQGSTGTVTAKQRNIIATEMRELQEQLIGLTSGQYAGNSIFAGSAVDRPAYVEGLGATVKNADQSLVKSVTGSTGRSIAIEFDRSADPLGMSDQTYRYSTDGGVTWTSATLPANGGADVSLSIAGAQINLKGGTNLNATEKVTMIVRPAAIYNGSINGEAEVAYYGAATLATPYPIAEGMFSDPVAVKIDSMPTGTATKVEYSYSLDNGETWVKADPADKNSKALAVPGGQIVLDVPVSGLAEGEQFLVEPVDASIEIEVSPHTNVQVNSVGSDIFGGVYINKATGEAAPVTGPAAGRNLFEVVGELIGFLEMDDQDGVKECLANLNKANEHITSEAGVLGGRQARLEFSKDAHGKSKVATEGRISVIQDVDIAKITTDSARAQYIYEAVLTTSSKVMNMSLLKYL